MTNIKHKTFLKILFIVFFAYLLCLSKDIIAQASKLPKLCIKSDYNKTSDSLQSEYGKNKSIPEQLETACLLALSKFPELKSVRIEFRFRKIKTTMAARPKAGMLFHKKTKRRYLVSINNDTTKISGALFNKISYNALVGLFGHELAHINDYNQLRFFGIIRYGIRYLFPNQKKKIEARTDSLAIARGFGWQIYEFSDFVMNKADIPEKYRQYKKRFYLKPEGILKIMAKHGYAVEN